MTYRCQFLIFVGLGVGQLLLERRIRKLGEAGTLNRLDFKPIEYKDERDRMLPMFELSERGSSVRAWMPYFAGHHSGTDIEPGLYVKI